MTKYTYCIDFHSRDANKYGVYDTISEALDAGITRFGLEYDKLTIHKVEPMKLDFSNIGIEYYLENFLEGTIQHLYFNCIDEDFVDKALENIEDYNDEFIFEIHKTTASFLKTMNLPTNSYQYGNYESYNIYLYKADKKKGKKIKEF